ncbi:hypothetical protein Tco_0873661 [Tanacetum coccineum]|uniref:Uncharacterized protein n=1 Tax=Tanacetum coccineum TaxID=301880 RepID=A0ABQ5BJF4_9ASTR
MNRESVYCQTYERSGQLWDVKHVDAEFLRCTYTAGEFNTRSQAVELHEHDTQVLYAVTIDAPDVATHQSFRPTVTTCLKAYTSHPGSSIIKASASEYPYPDKHHVSETRFQMQQAEIVALRESNRKCKAQMVEMLRVMRDMRREMGDMQAELLAHREQQRRARQPGGEDRIPNHQDATEDADNHI